MNNVCNCQWMNDYKGGSSMRYWLHDKKNCS
jgi:hypothetical protein